MRLTINRFSSNLFIKNPNYVEHIVGVCFVQPGAADYDV